ncbi:hypothetical protein [Lysobacter enzymogenes]|uniref:hypothetical protein n=1 Tax=Lysobacter enzymogenes TaxID=69 RepID=UPI001A95FC78|nr:hypothetical protein [Lysobacter enzymogenes]QQP97118.1 hypothetical protein JHW38_03435 [Lysobacter enzymogenes]
METQGLRRRLQPGCARQAGKTVLRRVVGAVNAAVARRLEVAMRFASMRALHHRWARFFAATAQTARIAGNPDV